MTIINMSLHRVIAAIKAIETNLSQIHNQQFVVAQIEDAAKNQEVKVISQSNFDKVQSAISNLAALKSARNKANNLTTVSIAGTSMTIDEALAKKAAMPAKLALVQTLMTQFTMAQRQAETNATAIEAKLAQQIAAMFTGTRKATQEEIDVLRAAAERNQKVVVVAADGLKERVEVLKKEIEDFNLEVDFVLSEINAVTKVDVNLN